MWTKNHRREGHSKTKKCLTADFFSFSETFYFLLKYLGTPKRILPLVRNIEWHLRVQVFVAEPYNSIQYIVTFAQYQVKFFELSQIYRISLLQTVGACQTKQVPMKPLWKMSGISEQYY